MMKKWILTLCLFLCACGSASSTPPKRVHYLIIDRNGREHFVHNAICFDENDDPMIIHSSGDPIPQYLAIRCNDFDGSTSKYIAVSIQELEGE